MIYKKSNKRKYKIKLNSEGSKKNFKKNKKQFFEIFMKKPWANYIGDLNLTFEEKSLLSKTMIQRKKILSIFNKNLENSKLSPFFFKPWVKGKKFFSTERQKHLKELYRKYNNSLDLKERRNFLKTSFGEILKAAYLHSPDVKALWVSARVILSYKKKKKKKKVLFEKSSLKFS